MAIYEITLTGTYFGNAVLNRWNYVSGGIPASVSGSFGLAFAFGLAVPASNLGPFRAIKDMLAVAMAWTGYRVVNLYDPEDFYAAPFGSAQPGVRTGEGLAPYTSIGFRSNQVTTSIARGTKRFAGVSELDTNPGGLLIASFMTNQLIPVATAMSNPLTYDDEGNTITYSPAILSREEYVTPSGKPAYRKYATEAEQLANAAIGIQWEHYTQVRSQVSRQYGRGA